MNDTRQIFQTSSRVRWTTFQWSSRVLLALAIFAIPVVIFTISHNGLPALPLLNDDHYKVASIQNPVTPAGLTKKELKRYKGFNDFLNLKQKNETLRHSRNNVDTSRIRAAFYVDWDPQAYFSLQKNIDKLNMVIPEWFFIDPLTDTLKPSVDMDALALMKKNHVRVLPLINNINPSKGEGEFDSQLIHRILHSQAKKQRLINDIVKYCRIYGLQGINIDFEEFKERSDEPIISFQHELYDRLHSEGLIVTQDIMANDEDFNPKELSRYNDYVFLMAYDEHYSTSVPGSVSGQQWIEKVLDETAKEIPSEKIILCIAGYGYDWQAGQSATTVSYQEALTNAKQYNAGIKFDNGNYSSYYSYKEPGGSQHEVYFNDAASNFNTIRFADQYGTAGTALWRLGSEDERLWKFYSRDLGNQRLSENPFDYRSLENVTTVFERPDYIGDGEILSVVTDPQPGKISLQIDTAEALISEQHYIQLPTKYVIRKYGNVHKQVLLTFDDGPDATYTPQILDILKKEKIHATFFVVGIEAENNLPLLRRIYEEGHEIGNHTFTHPNIAEVSAERAATEMESTRLLIQAVTGHNTILFRAPYNADAEPTTDVELRPVALSKTKNYYSVGESIDPNDWEPGVNADTVYNRTIRQYEANPEKGIILLHDAGGNRQATVDALPAIIRYFKQRNIQFTDVAGLLGKTKDEIMPPVHDSLVKVNSGIAFAGYGIEQFLTAAFWIAIILGLARILLMAVLAIIRRVRKTESGVSIAILASDLPAVSIIVPAYNEEVNAVNTIRNLLQQDYPYFDIIFVDDGSKDETYKKVLTAFRNNDQVKVLSKLNGGKASALNYGISQTGAQFVICIDADTQLNKDAVTQLMSRFVNDVRGTDEKVTELRLQVGAVAGNVKVGNKRNMLTRWQSIEYITAQNFDRTALDLVNGITVVPGAIGAFRKSAIESAGGFTSDTLAEDCDLTIRILRAGFRVVNCNEAVAVTEAPETLSQFIKQRFRWSYGIMQSFWKNRDVCFRPRFGALGMISLPNILIFQIILPILAPIADLMLVVSLIWNHHDPGSLLKIELFYLLFFGVDIFVSVIAYAFAKENLKQLFWLIPQRLVYRQLMYLILFKALRKAIKGESQGWGVLKRTGNVKVA
ncbi:MAG: glycosyltransferase [Chitinophagaceae bacterium]|nr:MAG: glycosyltransferase [Chitinophagaceae bacterium]